MACIALYREYKIGEVNLSELAVIRPDKTATTAVLKNGFFGAAALNISGVTMYVIYDIETGVVDRILRYPRNQVHMNVFEGQAFVELEDQTIIDDPANSYVLNGDLVRISSGPPHHDWDWTTKSWHPNLEAAREAQRQAWNAWRDRELVAGYSHNGHVFHSDVTFIAELQLLLKGYEREYITSTSAIRTRDNDTLQMTHAEIEGLLLLSGLHRQAIYAQSWVGKDLLASLTTLESITAGGPPE